MAGCSPSGLPGGSGRDRSRGLSIGTTLLVTSAAASYSPVDLAAQRGAGHEADPRVDLGITLYPAVTPSPAALAVASAAR